MSRCLYKKGDIVSVSNYKGNYSHYIGRIEEFFVYEDLTHHEELLITCGEGPNNTKAHVKIKPIYELGQYEYWWSDCELPEIEDDELQIEDPHNITLIKEEIYEETILRFMGHMNKISQLLYGRDEFTITNRIKKPKGFKLC